MIQNNLTVRIKPYSGESLVSLLLRICKFNEIRILHFMNSIKQWKTRYTSHQDLNLLDFAPTNIINIKEITKLTGLQEGDLLNCTFYNLIQLFCGESKEQRARFLSGVIRDTLFYCPECLQEKSYYKLLWKVKDIEVCSEHECLLEKVCIHCRKEIKYIDIKEINICPHCNKKLCKKKEKEGNVSSSQPDSQRWYIKSWEFLLRGSAIRIQSSESAIRILYILNNQRDIFDKELVSSNMVEQGSLPTILQHARSTLSTKRTLHISFLLDLLYKHSIEISQFIAMKVPEKFRESILSVQEKKSDLVFCFAPWCPSFEKEGSLIKTGTSLKNLMNGDSLHYYLFCKDCGCEYAFNEVDELIERGYFIEVYGKIISLGKDNLGFKELSKELQISEDKLRRVKSFLRTRIDLAIDKIKCPINSELLHGFLKAIESETNLKEIQQWKCWDSYEHFLTYRYHIKIMNKLALHKRSLPQRKDHDKEIKRIFSIVNHFYEKDKDITIATISKEVGFSPESLRLKGCLPYIAKIKQSQKEKRLLELKDRIYELVENYFTDKEIDNKVTEDIYKFIGVGRTVLWRKAPEVVNYIQEKRKSKQLINCD